MSTDNKTTNPNPPVVKLGWENGTEVTIKRKRYQVTEQQFQEILEKRIETKLTESLTFSTDDEKRAFIIPGNIITFKDKLPGFPRGQIAIAKIKRTKSGAIKIINPFGTESPLFNSEAELFQAIDWEWMQKNIIIKDETA
jgi:hypothetical protein